MKLSLTKAQIALAIAAYVNGSNLNVKAKPEDVTFENIDGEMGATLNLETVSRGRQRKEKNDADQPEAERAAA